MNKFGLELVLELVKSSLSQPSDAVFALVHWLVTSSQKFGCVGTGENFSDSDSQPSEVLPNDWNRSNKDDNGPFYSVRYRQKDSNQKYVVKMVFSIGTTWQLILCRTGDDKTVSMSINVEDEVSDTDGYPFKDVNKVNIFVMVVARDCKTKQNDLLIFVHIDFHTFSAPREN